MRRAWMVSVVALASACIPETPGQGAGQPQPWEDAGPPPWEDAGPPPWEDAGPPEQDAGPLPGCEPDEDLVELPVSPRRLPNVPLTTKELLGQLLFFDKKLSTPKGQSCAACHLFESGWTGPDARINATGAVYEGAKPKRFGNRKPNSSAYATTAPIFNLYPVDDEELFLGGNFWDGRATGEELGNPAADQAQGPPLNPVEQNNPDVETVCRRIRNSDYAYQRTRRTYEELFEEVWGPGALDCERAQRTYDFFALAIAAWEDSCQVNQYSSKYDAYLHGEATLTAQEARGLALFKSERAKCGACHPAGGEPGEPMDAPPLFTDHSYDNLGVPPNPCNPWYTMPESFNPLGALWLDLGLGVSSALDDFPGYESAQMGKMKVPTLRNVDLHPESGFVKAYMHNGFFKSLEGVVHFYNTRDVLPRCEDIMDIPYPITEAVALEYDCWPAAEVPINVNTDELGDLGLSAGEEADLVAFLKTLSDGYTLPRGCPQEDPYPDLVQPVQ